MKRKLRAVTAAGGILLLVLALALVTAAQTAAQTAPQEMQQKLTFWEELAFWQTIRDAEAADDLKTFLELYPDGRFAGLARIRLQALQSSPARQPPAVATDEEPASLYAATTNLNVRAAPTRNAARLTGFENGEAVRVIGEAAGGDWYRVRLDDGSIGYVLASLLRPQQAESGADGDAGSAAPGEDAGGDTFRDCPDCPLMARIPPGEFVMGSETRREEQPPHTVRIERPFALGVFEISVEEWTACVDAGRCRYDPAQQDLGTNEPEQPVSNLSWEDAREYTAWLSQRTGESYRLPSEAEWEYAARAGTGTAYWWGEEPGDKRANCQDCGSRWDGRQAAPVGMFEANPFGLYDVHGNVLEWTADCWNGSYQGAPADGSARTDGDCIARVLRGGSWRADANAMRATRRTKYDRDVRYFLNGFRVARDL